MDDELRNWVEQTAGGRIAEMHRPPAGGSRELYFVDVERTDGTVVPLVVRCEAGGSFSGTEISPAKEAVVYRALEHTAVPVPRVVGLAPGGAALLMERVAGSGDFSSLDDGRARRDHGVVRRRARGVAQPRRRHACARRLRAAAAAPRITRVSISRCGRTSPTTASGSSILSFVMRVRGCTRTHRSTWRARCSCRATPVLGNFVFDNGTVTGIVDWEFAHIGDPMDDWAWLDMRLPGADLSALQDRYARATGIEIDHDRIRYYRAAVDYRCAVTTSLAVSRGGGARGWAPYLLVTERYVLGLAERLSALLGVVEEADVPVVAPTARTPSYDHLLDGIRAAVRSIDDVDAREGTRNLQILVHYLRAYDEIGTEIEALDRDDRVATIGADALDDARFAALVEQAGTEGDEPMFRYLLRHTQRERLLWASLLDRPRRT